MLYRGRAEDEPYWILVNGLWGLFLACGFVSTAVLAVTARSWRFGNSKFVCRTHFFVKIACGTVLTPSWGGADAAICVVLMPLGANEAIRFYVYPIKPV